MNEMIKNIGERIVVKMSVVNTVMKNYDGNKRENPLYSELQGMFQMLKAMNIEFNVLWNYEVTEMTGIEIMGKKFKVNN